ncbi:FAD-dependent oxidoreductase [Glycomyces paridis]|uniref:FAD-dependent monooxygenase n=1 Tax=Glycomyces paridis TaxID=2126555 RepID=A0A4S8P8L2_9ACTN|nr:NAD(P)/FAD-dependent oxidoreductase [Glycomyces paridis]THV26540.1 FAD-dependent monooxygenase [Glycomyces paridis]
MLQPVPLHAQIDAAARDRLRVLVVGAGAAGLTAAQALRARGLHPVLAEKGGPDAPCGYMLALMPLVDQVFAGLGLTDAYRAASVPMDRYRIRGRHGAVVREYSLEALMSAYGDYRGIGRGELLAVLASHGGPVAHRTTVTAIEEGPEAARVTLDEDGTAVTAEFDLVIAADGLHSATRALVLPPESVSAYDTGWGGWVVWAEPDADADLGEELWAAGMFAGTYPVKGRLGVILCAPRGADEAAAGLGALVERLREAAPDPGGRIARVLAEAVDGRRSYYWSLTDRRCAAWSSGRTVLVGDAAAGFLPTAGIGAGMAMESAWALAQAVGDCEPAGVRAALEAFERAQRPRVEAAQDNSRQLAPLMFNTGTFAAAVRDAATRLVPLRVALGPIRKLLKDRPLSTV